MRGFQICSLARERLGDRFDFAMQSVPNLRKLGIERAWIAMQPRDTVFILIKDAVDRFSQEGLERLQRKSAGVALDHIDRHRHIMPPRGIDIHISASVSGVSAMKGRIAELEGTPEAIEGDVALLLHGVDQRLYELPKATYDRFRAAYLGSPHVTTIPEEIADQIKVVDATTTEKMAENYRAISGYNFHYAIRKIVEYPHLRGRKPFTKAFTAAVLGANVITHADEDDALLLLDESYPYMATSTDHQEIVEVMHKAKRTFGGPDWTHAQKEMTRLAEMVSFDTQAADLEAILLRLLD